MPDHLSGNRFIQCPVCDALAVGQHRHQVDINGFLGSATQPCMAAAG